MSRTPQHVGRPVPHTTLIALLRHARLYRAAARTATVRGLRGSRECHAAAARCLIQYRTAVSHNRHLDTMAKRVAFN